MMATRATDQPRFLWTGLLILLPVLALGGFGIWSLSRERAAAFEEARQDAAREADRILAAGRQLVAPADWPIRGQIAASDARLISPPRFDDPPLPPLQAAPSAVAFDRLRSDTQLSEAEKSRAATALAVRAEGLTATGIPVKQLARLHALRWAIAAGLEADEIATLAEALCQDATQSPSFLTDRLLAEGLPYLADQATKQEFQNSWRATEQFIAFHERNREWLAGLQPATDGVLRWGTQGALCHVKHSETETGILEVQAISASAIEALALDDNQAAWSANLPAHFGARLLIGERLVTSLRADPEGGELLAERQLPGLRAQIVLADQAQLLAPVRTRNRRAAWLIGLASLAALAGWFAAWRAFDKQQALAAMKDNFVSAVSHELKAPVAAIGLMAEEMSRSDSKREEYATLIAGECTRLGSLVENVLAYARIQSGREAFEFEDADLGELVRAAADLMRPAASRKQMTIAVDAPAADELCAEVDPRAIGRALVNLLDNAVKYAPAGSSISLRAEAHGSAGARIQVSDQGTPISAAEQQQIFGKFYRAGSELTRETEGVGIGLSLVQHIAAAHGGKAFVESEGRTHGNTFVIQFDGKQ